MKCFNAAAFGLLLGGAQILNVTTVHATITNVTYDVTLTDIGGTGGTLSGTFTATFPINAGSFTDADITAVDLSVTGSIFGGDADLLTAEEISSYGLSDTIDLDGSDNITGGILYAQSSDGNFSAYLDFNTGDSFSQYGYDAAPYASAYTENPATAVIVSAPEPTTLVLGGLGGFRWYRRSRQLATVCQTSF